MQVYRGQSLNEYVVIGALVTLLLIPVLGALGTSMNESFTAMFSGKGGASAAVAATPAKIAGNASQASAPVPPLVNGKLQITGLPSTPPMDATSLHYALHQATGGGSQTASIEGLTGAMNQRLYAVADQLIESDGEPMPSNIKSLVLNLADAGKALAIEQRQALASGSSLSTAEITQYEASTSNVTRAYDTLMYELKTIEDEDPAYDELKEVVEESTGIITRLNYELAKTSEAYQTDYKSYFEQNLRGDFPGEISISPDSIPTLTFAEAGGIEMAAQDAAAKIRTKSRTAKTRKVTEAVP